jgi:hypothetical protein
MTRKRSVPDVEPLFDDRPKKRRRKKPKEEEPAECAAANCRLPAASPSRYCNVHTLVFEGMDKFRSSSRRAAARGDFAKGVGHGLLSTGLDLLGQFFGRAGNQVADAANNAAGNVDWSGLFAQAPPPQPTAARTCWEVLGLDPATATADDIRTVQRKLAAIYHADKKNPAIAAGKLAEINAAASEALRSR